MHGTLRSVAKRFAHQMIKSVMRSGRLRSPRQLFALSRNLTETTFGVAKRSSTQSKVAPTDVICGDLESRVALSQNLDRDNLHLGAGLRSRQVDVQQAVRQRGPRHLPAVAQHERTHEAAQGD